jgi:thioredoxin 1
MSTHRRPASPVAPTSACEAVTPSRPAPRNSLWRIGVPLLLAVTVIVVLASKPGRNPAPSATAPVPMGAHASGNKTASRAGLPRLVDLGADKCIPCKAMAPILAELRTEYAGRMRVDFIDVWKDPSAGGPYRIYVIPTQIFFDGNGTELTRHEGFISKADILATWKQFGLDFSSLGVSTPEN